MVVETFKQDPRLIYERFDQHGRMMPDGLEYVSSHISADMTTCWQLMRTDKPELFEVWKANWRDFFDFEIVPVLTSSEARDAALEDDSL